jgi:hypothetical protein
MLMVILTIDLPLLVAGNIDLAHHFIKRDMGWTVGKRFPLKTTSVQIGNKYIFSLCATWIDRIILPNLFHSSRWFEA